MQRHSLFSCAVLAKSAVRCEDEHGNVRKPFTSIPMPMPRHLLALPFDLNDCNVCWYWSIIPSSILINIFDMSCTLWKPRFCFKFLQVGANTRQHIDRVWRWFSGKYYVSLTCELSHPPCTRVLCRWRCNDWLPKCTTMIYSNNWTIPVVYWTNSSRYHQSGCRQ
jgi:hypothetical protein